MFRKTVIGLAAMAAVFTAPAQAFEKTAEVSIQPFALAFGITDLEFGYYATESISVGLGYFSWSPSLGDSKFSVTGYQPFARYYFTPNDDSVFIKLGYMSMKFDATSDLTSLTASASASGPIFGAGYNWTWNSGFTLDLGFEAAAVSAEAKYSDGSSEKFNYSGGGLLFRLGWAF